MDNATSACQYCAYKVGDQFYSTLDLDYGNRWRDLGIFLAFIGSNLVFLFLGVSLPFLEVRSLGWDANAMIVEIPEF